ncbi:MAG: type II toxin-antitoxin system VapC family toxin [Acetobacteraceae bacterium]
MEELGWQEFLEAVTGAARMRMSVANWLEAAMVVESRSNDVGVARFEEVVREVGIELVPVSVKQATLARDAWRRFGRSRHPARLNYGDCFADALAKETGHALLFKGNDFSQIDIEPALKV